MTQFIVQRIVDDDTIKCKTQLVFYMKMRHALRLRGWTKYHQGEQEKAVMRTVSRRAATLLVSDSPIGMLETLTCEMCRVWN